MDDRRFPDPTRRMIVGGLATAGVAAAAGPAAAQQGSGGGQPQGGSAQGTASPPTLRNPAEMFPQPPFPKQEQPWPGIQAKMDPQPDCGETRYHGTGRLAGRRALITGGDSGIGRAAAIAFAREGADVAFGYVEEEQPDADEVVRLIREAGRKAVPLPGDIRDEAFCKSLVQNAVDELGGLDILVNNAARQQWAPSIEEISTEQFDATLKTNNYALFWITKAAIPHMPAGSAIINTTSIVAYQPPKILLDYAMTKAAIVTFTEVLAKQLAEKGIRVNAVAPGPFWTPLQVAGGQTMDNVQHFGADTPYGRPGQPVELAPLYVTLASPDSSYSSGQVFGGTGASGGP